MHLLDDLFSGSGRPPNSRLTVLLIDEIDMLISRDQSVLYNVFGWPQQPGARLVVIGIANTLDLPERLLPKIARCDAAYV
jgi:origin recognition complex subunit 1